MSTQFSGTGINNGLTVEANQVSQSVDAFTGNKAYDIVISGSLELTGSLFLTGSLINEYTGQFKTLGIGIAAPTEPTMLHIKTTDGGGDPLVLIEASAGANNAQLQLQNDTTYYELGNYGDLTNTFRIRQGPAGGAITKTPFIIGSNTADYTMFLDTDSVGIGLGINTPTILSPLAAGSLQAEGTLTGSLVQGNIISASDAGVNVVNIHGTSSYANYATTVVTASYIEATNIDFSVGTNTITQDIFSSANITTTATSSFGRAQMGVGGISTPDSLGSTGDTLKFITLLTLPASPPTTTSNGETGDLSTSSNGTGTGVTVRVTAAGGFISQAQVRFGGNIGTGYEAGDTITVSKTDMDGGNIGTVSGDLVMTIQQSNMTSPYYEIISGSSDNLQIGNIDLNAALNGTRLEIDSGNGRVRVTSTEDFRGNLFVQDDILAGTQVKVSGSSSPSIIVGYDSPGSSGLRSVMGSNNIHFQGQPNDAYIYNDNTGPNAKLHLGTGNTSTESGLYVSGSKEVTIPNGPLNLLGAAAPTAIDDLKIYQIIGHETAIDGSTPGIFTTKINRIIQFVTTSISSVSLIKFEGGASGNIPDQKAIYNFKLVILGIKESSSGQGIYMEEEWTFIYDPSTNPEWTSIATSTRIVRSTSEQTNSVFSAQIAADALTFSLIPGSTNNCRWDGMVEVEILQESI
tara:strand:+ start:1014 stop:3074 length:2061 start_codon:yes stop_codon:yes gene_type:complete